MFLTLPFMVFLKKYSTLMNASDLMLPFQISKGKSENWQKLVKILFLPKKLLATAGKNTAITVVLR